MDRSPLDDGAISAALESLPGWTYGAGRLEKTFNLGDFRRAMAFIVRLGFEAEELNHHPELRNVYGRVSLSLTTHDAGNRVTGFDIAFAHAAERVAGMEARSS